MYVYYMYIDYMYIISYAYVFRLLSMLLHLSSRMKIIEYIEKLSNFYFSLMKT